MIEDGDERLNDDEQDGEKPETVGKIDSSDPIDDWLLTVGGESIEIVDSASQLKGTEKLVPDAAVPEEEAEPEPAPAAEEEEGEDSYKTNDPVRMYLRKMGSVSLLTREGEVEIAKRMEDGERRVLQVVLNSSVAIEETLDLGDRLRQQKIRVKEVVQDADEDDAEFDESWHVERVCQAMQKVRRLRQELQKVEERKTASEAARKKVMNRVAAIKQEMIDALQKMRLKKQQIDHIVARLKGLVSRIEAAQREIADCEQRAGMPSAGSARPCARSVPRPCASVRWPRN